MRQVITFFIKPSFQTGFCPWRVVRVEVKQEGTDKQSNFFTFETVELKKFHSALSRSAFTELAAQPRKVELLTCHPFCQICGKRGQIILLRVLLLAPKTTRSSLHGLITLLKRGCCDHAARRNILTTLRNFVSWSMGLCGHLSAVEFMRLSGRKKFLEMFQGSAQHFCCSITFDFLPFVLPTHRCVLMFKVEQRNLKGFLIWLRRKLDCTICLYFLLLKNTGLYIFI